MITKKQLLEAIEKATYNLDIPHPTPNLFRDIKLVVEALPDESTECEHDWKPIYGSRKLDDRTTFFDGPLVRYDCTKCGISKCAQEETKPDWEKKLEDILKHTVRLDEFKDFIRDELKAMGKEIAYKEIEALKAFNNGQWMDAKNNWNNRVNEALKKRGVK